jgi:hypothetical protein
MDTGTKRHTPPNPASPENVNAVLGYAKWLFDASGIAVAENECGAVAKTLIRLAPLATDAVRTHETRK